MRVDSRVAERLKAKDLRKLVNIRKVLKRHRTTAQCGVFLSENNFFNTSKNLLKNRTRTLNQPMFASGILQTITFILFWDFLMFYQIFFSPQVKRCAIVTNKYSIYDLSNELANELSLRILGNQRVSGKSSNAIEKQPSAPPPRINTNFANTSKNLSKNRY